MLDNEILRFYNSVKDTSWPDIQDYYEFCQLPAIIKNECNDMHGFQQRKQQIVDNNYWANLFTEVCVYKNLAFLPVPKCAYVYYTTLFTNLGWEKVPLSNVDIANTQFFGTIIHPLTRWVKGIAEWILWCYKVGEEVTSDKNPWIFDQSQTVVDWPQLTLDLQTTPFKKLISTVNVGDIHSMPYSSMYGDLLDKINWIPMDILTDNEAKISMMNFFKLHGHDIVLPLNDKRLHVSEEGQLKLQNTVKQEFLKNKNQIYLFYHLFSHDLKFYYNLIENFTTNWQHIKTSA